MKAARNSTRPPCAKLITARAIVTAQDYVRWKLDIWGNDSALDAPMPEERDLFGVPPNATR